MGFQYGIAKPKRAVLSDAPRVYLSGFGQCERIAISTGNPRYFIAIQLVKHRCLQVLRPRFLSRFSGLIWVSEQALIVQPPPKDYICAFHSLEDLITQ